jgi:hypothetical protein
MPNSTTKPRVMRATVELAQKARWDDAASERLNVEVYADLFSLSLQYRLNLDAALVERAESVNDVPLKEVDFLQDTQRIHCLALIRCFYCNDGHAASECPLEPF